MGAGRRMVLAKGLVASLLTSIKLRRYRLALFAFRERECRCLYGPGRSLPEALAALESLSIGGKTPLGYGLERALEFMLAMRRNRRAARQLLLVVSDGNGNLTLDGSDPYQEALLKAAKVARAGVPAIFIDTEPDACAYGFGRQVARAMGGKYYVLEAARRRGVLELEI